MVDLDESLVSRLLSNIFFDINIQDRDGRTALFWASLRGNERIVSLLIGKGANVNLKTKVRIIINFLSLFFFHSVCLPLWISFTLQNGESPLDIARKYNHSGCIQLLELPVGWFEYKTDAGEVNQSSSPFICFYSLSPSLSRIIITKVLERRHGIDLPLRFQPQSQHQSHREVPERLKEAVSKHLLKL